MIDSWKIQELRASVLCDLKEFIPEGYYRNVRTDDDIAQKDITLAIEIRTKNYQNPILTPRQLSAVSLLEIIGMYNMEVKPEDIEEGIPENFQVETALPSLQNAFNRYVMHLGESKEKGYSVTHLMPTDTLPQAEAVRVNGKKKTAGYQPRDDDFRMWIRDVEPDLNNMTWDEIHQKLKIRNSGLWTSGFTDWKKQQNIFKGKAGRKPKQ